MGEFLDAAFKVLIKADRALSPKEIVEIAIRGNLLRSRGMTPGQTMKARLSTSILRDRERSLFMRTSAGQFGLRCWLHREREYVADRFKKALMDEDVLVFPASSLWKYIPGRGLHVAPLTNTASLASELRPMLRRLAEKDWTVIQLVSSFIVRFGPLYLTYKRSKRLPEERLHGEYSLVFGGHLNPGDRQLPLFDRLDPQFDAVVLQRELREEVRVPPNHQPDICFKGLLYDDSRDLSRQHLGVVFDVDLKTREYEIGERGFLIDPKFETLEQIAKRITDFENWSVLVANFERQARDGAK